VATLVIDTATAACSVALVEGTDVLARAHEVVGRGHAERLLSMIAALPGGGRADRILVDCGPGSFTGVRVGLAAARALALGWEVPVAGYSSLPLVAAAAFARGAHDRRVAAVLEGGHGEVFMAVYDPSLAELAPLASLRPEAAVAALKGAWPVGSGLPRLRAVAPDLVGEDALPDAADAWRLPATLASLAPAPLYGRAPDAKIPGQR
jgi:tRNA threonylcarbamoyladenosine biosynthesis protein TsaB